MKNKLDNHKKVFVHSLFCLFIYLLSISLIITFSLISLQSKKSLKDIFSDYGGVVVIVIEAFLVLGITSRIQKKVVLSITDEYILGKQLLGMDKLIYWNEINKIIIIDIIIMKIMFIKVGKNIALLPYYSLRKKELIKTIDYYIKKYGK